MISCYYLDGEYRKIKEIGRQGIQITAVNSSEAFISILHFLLIKNDEESYIREINKTLKEDVSKYHKKLFQRNAGDRIRCRMRCKRET